MVVALTVADAAVAIVFAAVAAEVVDCDASVVSAAAGNGTSVDALGSYCVPICKINEKC